MQNQTQPKLLPKNLTFRPLSDSEAFIKRSWYSGTQFFRFLTQREDAVSRKWSYLFSEVS